MDATLIGREQETAALARFIGAVEELPGAMLIEGEAGIGKTSLLRAGLDMADGAGHRILSCRPAEAETKLGFAARIDLIGDSFGEVADDLPDVQRRALRPGHILKDGSATVTIEARLTTAGSIVNTAVVEGSEQDPNTADNTASQTTIVTPNADGCNVVGSAGKDFLVGTPGDDTICGLGGNDTLIGDAGNDTAVGGPGFDDVFGGTGADFLKIKDGVHGNDSADGGVDAGTSAGRTRGIRSRTARRERHVTSRARKTAPATIARPTA
jgi:hypothetical protein